jgi:hypothetical protein
MRKLKIGKVYVATVLIYIVAAIVIVYFSVKSGGVFSCYIAFVPLFVSAITCVLLNSKSKNGNTQMRKIIGVTYGILFILSVVVIFLALRY